MSDSDTMGIAETDLELRNGTELEVADDSDNGDTADEDTSSPVLCNVQTAR